MPDFTSSGGFDSESLPFISKTETLKRYRGRVEASKQWRDDEKFTSTWKRLRDIYRLRMFSAFSEEDRIAVAVAFATVNVIAPSVAVNHPKIVVLARNELYQDPAGAAENVVNYWWRHHDVKPDFRHAVKDFLVYGHGWVKVGWRYKEGERELEPEERSQVAVQQIGEADEYAAANPDLAGDMPTDDEIRDLTPQTEPLVIEDRPFVERVSPLDIFVDTEANNERELQWIAQRIVRPIEEVKHDKRYKAGIRRKVNADKTAKWHNEDSAHHSKEDVQRVTIWEFYDLQREQMCVFADQGDGFLIDPVPLPYSYGHPFVMIRNYEVPDQFYPIGEIEAIEPLQNELNETRTSMVNARKMDQRKWLYRNGAFSPDGLDALRSSKDNVMVPVDSDEDFNRLISPMPKEPALQPGMYQHSDQILEDVDRVTGVSEYQRGMIPETRRTATEASMIQDAANARAADKLDIIETAISQLARRLVQLAQAYLTGPQVARITSETADAQGWLSYSRESIQGEFDFNVEAGSTQPQNETFRRQQAMQLAQAMAPFVQMGIVNPTELAAHLLREGFGVKNPERFIQQLPMMPMGAQPPGAEGQQPGGGGGAPPGSEQTPPDALGGTDAVPPEVLAQLAGQIGFKKPNTLKGMVPTATLNGGGAMGPAAP